MRLRTLVIILLSTCCTLSYGADRTITFQNQCPFPVWPAVVSGAAAGSADTGCQSDQDCPQGAVCNTKAGSKGICYWQAPQPKDGEYQIPAGESKDFIVTAPPGNNVVWSGAIAGRTNCRLNGEHLVCDTGTCETDLDNQFNHQACNPGAGATPPATQAEITMQNNLDYYDIEVINGINIPLSFGPSGNVKTDPSKPYYCTTPGKLINSGPGQCTWTLKPPAANYVLVSPSNQTCSATTDCQNGNVCGLSVPNAAARDSSKLTCGKFLGYWSADQVCSFYTPNQPIVSDFFKCSDTSKIGEHAVTFTDLNACVPPDVKQSFMNTCYRADFKGATDCCGCPSWVNNKLPVLQPYPDNQACAGSNPDWTSKVLPSIKWLKQACTTAYTFPFDDPSSSFTCTSSADNTKANDTENATNYTVTFCPGGKTGAPQS